MIELLAPAGSPESLTAAVQGGADAVYLGCGPLNARRNAKNFTQETLAEAVQYCHLRGVKVYLTMNTLLRTRELPQAAELAACAADAGVDAVLVQDLGAAKLLRDTVPKMPLHASTQMTVHNLDGILACADLGMERVVLSREMPRSELERLCAASPIELEIFVHGALCMSYSGQCWLSAVLGGRSGNRGLCAQPCRLPFSWPEDRRPGHPLSLRDLSLAEHLQELEQMGIACLKIEGRMKRAEYVSVVTRTYADALREGRKPGRADMRRLEEAFSRQGFTQGYYDDRKGPEMFGTRREGEKEPAEMFAQERAYYAQEHRKIPVSFALTVRQGSPMRLTAADADGNCVQAEGAVPEPARTRAVTEEQLAAQMKKTGGTVFSAEQTEAVVEDGLSVPMAAVNALRREALNRLSACRAAPVPREVHPMSLPAAVRAPKTAPVFSVSLRKWEQLSPELLRQEPALVCLPVDVMSAHAKELPQVMRDWPQSVFCASLPRVYWDREAPALRDMLDTVRKAGVKEVMLGHLGQMRLAKEFDMTYRGDFGLGLCNDLAAWEFSRLGFASCMVSFELKLAQVRALWKGLPTELLVYGHLPLMLTENCIIRNRGKGCLCEKKPQSLRDRKGESFPVEKAFGCRNEIFNGKCLWLADRRAEWESSGVTMARLNFLRESPAECARILRVYREGSAERPQDFTRGLYDRGVE